MATKIIIDADVNSLISQIDKAAARFEKFSSAGSDSIDEVSASYDKLTEKEKRAFDASKKQFNEKVASMQKLEKEYEALRSKQEQGIKLSQDECKRLKDINKEYKTLANATRQISNEMSGFAKDLKKAATAENQIRTRTPQVTHKFADLKAETLALAAALGLGSDAFVSMGLEADKQLQKLNAMLGSTEAATKAYYEMADAQRYLGIDADVFNEYYAKLTKVTGSAQTAAHHLKLMGDAAANAGMLTGQFDQLVDQLEIIKANGFFTDTNIEMLEELGLTGVKKELESAFGVPYEMISKSNGDQVYNAIISWFEKAFAGSREIQNDSMTGIFTEIAHDVSQIAHEISKVFLDDLGFRGFFKSFSDGSKKFVEELRKMNYGVQSFREAMNNTFGETAVDTGYTAMYGAIGYGATEAATSLWGLVQASSGFEKVKKELTKGNKYKEFDFLVTKAIAAKKALDNFNEDKKAKGDYIEPEHVFWAEQKREELKDIINLSKAQDSELKAANNLLANHERLNKEYEMAVDNVNNLRQSVIKLAKEIRSSSEDEYCLVPIELLNEEKNYIKAISESRKKDADATLKHAKVVKDATEEKVTSLKKSYASFKESITSTFTKSSAAIKKYKIDTVGVAADVGGTLADLAGTTNKNMSRMGFFAAWKQGFIALGAAAKACFASILTPITGITIAIAALAKLADNLYDKYKDADFGSLLEHAMRGEDLPESEAVKQALEGLKVKEKEVQFQKTLNKLSYNSQGLMDAHNKELNKKISRTKQLAKVSEEAAKAAEKQRKEEYAFAKENLARTQYAENYSLALAAKANADRLNNDIEYYANLESLMQGFGAVEKSLDAQRLKNKKQLAKDLFEVENNYATQLKSLQDRLDLKNLDLSNASTANEKSLIKKDIEQIEKEIANINFKHPDNLLEIEVRANVNQLTADLQEAVNKQKPDYVGQANLGATLGNFQSMAQNLSQSYATGDMEGVMSIGRLLGMTEEEIIAKGSTIEQVYETIANAMVNASAKQVTADQAALENAKALKNFMTDYQKNFISGFGDAFSEMVAGAKSAKEAFGDFARSVIQEVVAMIAKLTAMYLLMLLCGFGGKAWANAKALTFGGTFQKKAKGGYITGPGTSRSDSIPAMLSNGEYVLNAAAVNAIGVHRLDQMNKGYLPKFADGGLVGKSNASQPVVAPNINLTVSALDASSFDNFLRRGGLDKIKQAFYSDNLKFAANAGVF